jgi:hypothetical protein
MDLQGIQSIGVNVTNVSASHHLDPTIFAKQTAFDFNLKARKCGVSAHSVNDPGVDQAELEITVLSENATPHSPPTPGKPADWLFQLKTSATLKTKAGQVLWHTDDAYSIVHRLYAEGATAPWSPPFLRIWLTDGLSSRLVDKMLYQR